MRCALCVHANATVFIIPHFRKKIFVICIILAHQTCGLVFCKTKAPFGFSNACGLRFDGGMLDIPLTAARIIGAIVFSVFAACQSRRIRTGILYQPGLIAMRKIQSRRVCRRHNRASRIMASALCYLRVAQPLVRSQ